MDSVTVEKIGGKTSSCDEVNFKSDTGAFYDTEATYNKALPQCEKD